MFLLSEASLQGPLVSEKITVAFAHEGRERQGERGREREGGRGGEREREKERK